MGMAVGYTAGQAEREVILTNVFSFLLKPAITGFH